MSEEVKSVRKPRPKKPAGEGAAAAGSDAKPAAAERPKTAARSGRRGGATGGAAGAEESKDGARGGRRPQTARQAANFAEGNEETKGNNPRGDGNRGGKGKDQRGARQQDKAQDKNSWIYKYHNMERIEYEKVQFTEDTVIPELPAPKDRLKEPLKSDFERVMADQDRLI